MYWYEDEERYGRSSPLRWMEEPMKTDIEILTDDENDKEMQQFSRICEELSVHTSEAYNMDKPAKRFYGIFLDMFARMEPIIEEIKELDDKETRSKEDDIRLQKLRTMLRMYYELYLAFESNKFNGSRYE